MQPQLKSISTEAVPPERAQPLLPDVTAFARPNSARLHRVVRWIGIPLLLALAIGGWLVWHERPLAVTITTPHVGGATALVYATGFVEADHPVSVSSRLTAPIVRVLVDEGDHVVRGQPLALLEADQQRALLDQASANASKTASDEQRSLALFAQGWSTRANRDASVSAAEAARAGERSARAALNQLVVRAGVTGVVIKRDAEPGSLAVPGVTLFQLGDPNHMRVTATVDERDVPRLRVGQPALMTNEAWPGRVIHGHVREVTPNGDPTQRAFRVRLTADDARDLPFGLTLEVNIVTAHDDAALLVPADAVDGGRVWLMRDGRAHRQAIVTGIIGARDAQVVRGLNKTDQVITDAPPDLHEGDRVRARR